MCVFTVELRKITLIHHWVLLCGLQDRTPGMMSIVANI